MKKRILSLTLALVMLLTTLPLEVVAVNKNAPIANPGDGGILTVLDESGFSGGDGSVENPYLISTAEQLNAVRDNENASYKLTADIDISDYDPWSSISNYYGTFDGNGHMISGLSASQGLFDTNKGTIQNLNISGKVGTSGSVGGIVVTNQGTIRNCRNDVTVQGSVYVGGIAGANFGLIDNCYNTGSITKTGDRSKCIGGIVGANLGTVQNCYNVGYVSAPDGTRQGAISGQDGTTINCYYLTGSSSNGLGIGFYSSGGAAEKSAEEFKTLASALGDAWAESPYLDRPVLKSNPEAFYVAGGEDDPSIIPTLTILEQFRNYVNSGNDLTGKYFILTSDIDINGSLWDQWIPIGLDPNTGSNAMFTGTFDGDGHTVSGVYVDNGSNGYQGFFGYVVKGGTVKKLVVEGYIAGRTAIGGVVGVNYGTVEDCCFTGRLYSMSSQAGGIVGANYGTVKNCYTGVIGSSNSAYGGIFGYGNGTTENCYYLADEKANGSGTPKTADEFSSGEVAWLLGDAWGQTIGMDSYPVLDSSKAVYKVSFQMNDVEINVKYVNYGSTVELPEVSDIKSYEGLVWTANGAEFTQETPISGDTVVTGEIVLNFDGEGTEEVPYEIPDYNTLLIFRDYINTVGSGASGKYFIVTNDIAVTGTWNTIGGTFYGIFDGAGHMITNLNGSQGLFNANSGTIKNVGVSGNISANSADRGGIVGTNNTSGVIEGCYNAASVTCTREAGGIAGKNSGLIKNCFNAGTITVTNASTNQPPAGGIVGQLNSPGNVQNCYNTGTITSTNNVSRVGGIAGINNGGSVSDCYWTGSSKGGVPWTQSGGKNTNVVNPNSSQIASGEVAYNLQGGQDEYVWGQKLPGGSIVLLAFVNDPDEYRVLKVNFVANGNENYSVLYTNPGTVALPNSPTRENYVFYEWQKADGTTFDSETYVTYDTTVTAAWRETFAGDANATITTTYGTEAQKNMDEWLGYVSSVTSAQGNFTYSFAENGNPINATIEGSTITVPTGINAGEYKLTVIAKEIDQKITPFALGNYGTDDVQLTVTVIVLKITPDVDTPSGLKAVYGQQLSDVKLPNGWTWDDIGTTSVGNAGEHSFSATYTPDDEVNYNTVTELLTVTVEKADLTSDMFSFTQPADTVYDGKEKAATANVKSDYIGVGTSITVKYYDEDGNEVNAPTDAGTYTVKITVSEGDNYNGIVDLEVGSFEIKYLDTPEDPYTVSGIIYTDKNGVMWIKDNSNATITPADGYKIATEQNGNYSDALSVNEWTQGSHIYLMDAQGHITDAVSVTETIKVDSLAPTGEIKVQDRAWWKSILHHISFGLFFKEEQTATVTVKDAESGIKDAKSLVLQGDFPETQNTDELIAWLNEQNGWTAFEGSHDIPLDKDGTYVIYVKIIDNVGHVTYIFSDGIVVYSDSIAVDTDITYTKTETTDAAAKIETRGNTVSKITIDGKTVDNENYTLSLEVDGITTVTFKAAWLDTFPEGTYTLTVSYDPQGIEFTGDENAPLTTDITLTVIKATLYANDFTFTPDNSLTYDGTGKTATVTPDVSGVGNVTVKYYADGSDEGTETAPKDAGTYTVKITVEASDNYNAAELTDESWTFTIEKATLTPAVAEVNDKVYDGNTETHGMISLTGAVNGETPTASGVFNFVDKNVSENKKVNVNVALDGDWGNNYKLSSNELEAAAAISPRVAEFAWTSETSFIYDGTQKTVTAELKNLVSGDNVTLIYSDNEKTDRGNYIAKVTGFYGTDSGNYTVTGSESAAKDWNIATQSLAQAKVTVIGEYTYTGNVQTPTVTVTLGDRTLTEGTDYTLSYANGDETEVKNAGTYKITVTGYGNYAETAEGSVTVEKATLTPSVGAVNDKVYDGSTNAVGEVKLIGAVNGEEPTATAAFTFTDKNAGTNKAVNAADIKLDGTWGDNYVLAVTSLTEQTTTAAIEQKEVGLLWSGHKDLVYNGEPVNVTAVATGIIDGDECTVTVTGGTETNVGTYTAKATELSNLNYKLPANREQEYTIAKAAQAAADVSIGYVKEILIGTDKNLEYKTSNDWQPCTSDMTLNDIGWNGSEMTVYFRYTETDNFAAGDVQQLDIPARPEKPDAEIKVTKSKDSIKVTQANGDYEYSIDNVNWNDSGVFEGLTVGTDCTLYVRTKAVEADSELTITLSLTVGVFASYPAEFIITTVNEDGSTTLQPGESIETEDGDTITNNGDNTTVTDEDGNTTTVTPPTSGDIEVDADGNVIAPEGSTVTPPTGEPEITLPDGGIVDGDGNITLPGGGKAEIVDKTVTMPEEGGTLKPDKDGNVHLPGGSIVEDGDGNIVVVPKTGGIITPDGTLLLNSYTVTFDSQGGSEVEPVEVATGDKVEKPSDPTRDGYTFEGWYKDADCTDAYDFNTPVTCNLTLFAKWAKIEDITPDNTPDVTPDTTPDATPDTTPDNTPDTTPDEPQDTTPADNDLPPATGDRSSILLWSALIIVAGLGVVLSVLLEKRRNGSQNAK